MRVIISGGGTGGHVYPAIAIANALRQKDKSVDILFVGAKGKLEMEKVPKAGYAIKGLWISGFHRTRMYRNWSFPFKLISSMWNAKKIIDRFDPDVAVGVGGYASGPVLEWATRKKIPSLIQEQNSFPGKTNKILSGKVSKICVAYPGMERFFPKEKIIMSGNPVRQDLTHGLKDKITDAGKHFDLGLKAQTVLVFGGSLGARTLNNAMIANKEWIENRSDVQFIWQIGKLYFDEFKNSDVAKLPNVRALPYLDRMDLAYCIADVIVARAGALSISELAIIAKPAILVPSPNVAEDHQTKNAMALVEKEAALMIKDDQIEQELSGSIDKIFEDEQLQEKLSQNMAKFARPNAAEQIAEEIIALANA